MARIARGTKHNGNRRPNMTPTQRSLAYLRRAGWTVAIVEHYNSWVKIRQDLFGFADLLAFKPGEAPLLVQTTSGTNVSARLQKIRQNKIAALWLEAGFLIHVHGWAK